MAGLVKGAKHLQILLLKLTALLRFAVFETVSNHFASFRLGVMTICVGHEQSLKFSIIWRLSSWRWRIYPAMVRIRRDVRKAFHPEWKE